MFKRTIAASLFLIGGLVTWFIVSMLQGFALSQAGMSSGPIQAVSQDSETAVILLLSSYFLIGIVSALNVMKKQTLWILWNVAHAMAILAFFILFYSEGPESGSGKLIEALPTAGVVMATFLMPGFLIWGWLFSKVAPSESESTS